LGDAGNSTIPLTTEHAEMKMLLSFLSGTLLFILYPYFPFSSLTLFTLTTVILFLRKKIFLALCVSLGIFYAFVRYSPAVDMPNIWHKELRVTGRFTQGGNAKGPVMNVETYVVDKAWDEESGEELDGLHDAEIGLPADFVVDYDDRYELLMETGGDRRRLNPGLPGKARLFGKVISAEDTGRSAFRLFGIFEKQRVSLNRYLAARHEGDTGGFVAALTTGRTAELSEEAKEAFNASGLVHILSISGTHFGMLSLLLFSISGFLIKRLPYRYLQRLTIYLTPNQAATLISLPFMVMYLGISGGSVPAVRSFVMIGLFLLGLLIDRKGAWLNSLLFAAFILVLWDPGVLADLSFELSFLAVLFIGFFAEKNDRSDKIVTPETKKGRLIRHIGAAVVVSVAATLGTAPLAAYHFHYLSVVSPLANLVIVPLVGFVVTPLALVAAFVYIFSGHYILEPLVSASAELTVRLVKLFAALPFAQLKVPSFPPAFCIFFYAGFLLYIVSGRSKKMLLLSFLPFCIYALTVVFEKKDLSVTFVDVGQGDSAVIELPDKKTLVVDTGRTGKETAAFLKSLGKRDIDALVLTHSHPDHTGGMEHLMKTFRVKELWDNGRIFYPPELHINAHHRILERGDTVEGAAYRITVLHPYKEFYSFSEDSYSEENSSSLVLKITGKKRSFLFAGDIEEEAEEDTAQLKKWLQSDVIKIPHHGSRTSAADDFLGEVSPSIAVISVGRDNSFGHPSEEVLQKLEGKRIFRTDRDGAVKIAEKDGDLLVKTCRKFMFERADNIGTEKGNIIKLFTIW
jgi:competence protein ComEC